MKKPWDVIIGAIAQFGIMPAVAYGFCLLYRLEDDYAIGVVLGASCPGGGLSNIACVLIDADVVLSIVLTFSTTVLALGMMPLCLWVYTSPFTDDETFPVPIRDIAIALGALIIPLAIGVIIRKQRPEWANKILKILRPFCIIVFLILAVFGTLSSRYIFSVSDRDMILCTFSFTTCGFLIGLIAGKICCRTIVQSKTVAIETGIKNSALALGIIAIVYPKPDADILTAVVLWYAAAQFFLILAMAVVYAITTRECYKKRCGSKIKSADGGDDNDSEKGSRNDLNKDDDGVFTVTKDPHRVNDAITAYDDYAERKGTNEDDVAPVKTKPKKKKKKRSTAEGSETAAAASSFQSEASETTAPKKKQKKRKRKKKKKKVSEDDTEEYEETTPRSLPPIKTVSNRIRQEEALTYYNDSFKNDDEL
ncbi:ileal sodium/bile acid cotransporter-like [Anneissia japonica]|uniref:ileal sodium/bile acid cotransporter-like n=1 Tax=Anneissia japonica TaxID=1529436 RepID=UPI001425AD82|nr:ileal sodium/bile acid cotransporter-like [Anneissia japonica]